MKNVSTEDFKKIRIDLVAKKKKLCEQVTLDIRKSIADIDKQLIVNAVKASEKNAETFREMALKVGEMFKMAFELYTIKHIDVNLMLTNHVQWIDLQGESYKYCKYGKGENGELVPLTGGEFQECYDKLLYIYTDAFKIN